MDLFIRLTANQPARYSFYDQLLLDFLIRRTPIYVCRLYKQSTIVPNTSPSDLYLTYDLPSSDPHFPITKFSENIARSLPDWNDDSRLFSLI